MIHLNQTFSTRVEACVARIESETDAEVVVVASRKSGHYADVVSNLSFAVSLLAILALSLLPWHVSPLFVVLDVIVVWTLARALLDHPSVIRMATRAERRDHQVQRAAQAEFHAEAVHGTPSRTGLLVYVSGLEQQVVLVPDAGLESRIPRGRWAAAQREFSHNDLDHFLSGLEHIGALLSDALPRTEEPRQNLTDAPRIRP